jgi:hypothetical protein
MRVPYCKESALMPMQDGRCVQVVSSEAVTDAYDRSGHLVTFHID